MADGTFPSIGHDGGALDEMRASLARAPLEYVGACLFIKCDLLELSSTLGLPSVNSSLHSCPFCTFTGDHRECRSANAFGLQWPRTTFAEYSSSCDRAEIWVTLDKDQFLAVRAKLRSDRRVAGVRGIALVRDIDNLNLEKGDRLEPHAGMPDIGAIEHIKLDEGQTVRLLFWRKRLESLARHRNPLFSERLGTTPQRVLTLDWLHILSLGVWKQCLGPFVQTLFQQDVWQTKTTTVESRAEASTLRMKSDLFAWYASEKSAGRTPTEVQNIVPTMFGTAQHPCFALHGSETNHFMRFAHTLVERFSEKIKMAHVWRVTIGAAVRIMEIIHEVPMGPLSVALIQEFTNLAIRINRKFVTLDIHGSPKNHQLLEMATRLREQGTPAVYSCWKDEELNGQIKKMASVCAKSAHATFERRLLEQWDAQLQRTVRRKLGHH